MNELIETPQSSPIFSISSTHGERVRLSPVLPNSPPPICFTVRVVLGQEEIPTGVYVVLQPQFRVVHILSAFVSRGDPTSRNHTLNSSSSFPTLFSFILPGIRSVTTWKRLRWSSKPFHGLPICPVCPPLTFAGPKGGSGGGEIFVGKGSFQEDGTSCRFLIGYPTEHTREQADTQRPVRR